MTETIFLTIHTQKVTVYAYGIAKKCSVYIIAVSRLKINM